MLTLIVFTVIADVVNKDPSADSSQSLQVRNKSGC